MTNQVTVEDLQGLAKSIELNIRGLQHDDIDAATRINVTIAGLTALKASIDNAVYKLKIPFSQQKELQIYDKVRITNVDDVEISNYIGLEGWIVGINLNYQYPYELDFGNENISNQWLWSAKNLKLL